MNSEGHLSPYIYNAFYNMNIPSFQEGNKICLSYKNTVTPSPRWKITKDGMIIHNESKLVISVRGSYTNVTGRKGNFFNDVFTWNQLNINEQKWEIAFV